MPPEEIKKEVDTEKAALPVVTPEKSETVVPEHLKGVTFSVEDFEAEQLPERTPSLSEKAREGEKEKEPEKVEKAVEAVKEDPEKVEPEKKAEEKKEEKSDLTRFLKPPKGAKQEPEKVVEKQVNGRDYSGFTTEEASALKQMSNEGFAFASKAIRDNKELSKLKDSTYLQHDQAYVLDPSYQQLHRKGTNVTREMEYWTQQLSLIDEGKNFKPITGIDKDGNFIYGPEMAPTKSNEEKVRLAGIRCDQALGQIRGELQSYPTKYKTTVTQDMQRSQQERAQRFPWAADQKLLEHEIELPGIGPRSIRKIQSDVVNLFPPYMQGHPAMGWVADLYVTSKLQEAEIAELKNGKQVADIKKEEKGLVEPTSKQGGRKVERKSINGVKEFVDDLKSIGL